MDTLYLKYTKELGHGVKIEYEKSDHGVWNTIELKDAIKTLKLWTKELEREYKEIVKL
jgi:hypothetical protein